MSQTKRFLRRQRDKLAEQLSTYYEKILKPYGEIYGGKSWDTIIYLNSPTDQKIICYVRFLFSSEEDINSYFPPCRYFIEVKIANEEIDTVSGTANSDFPILEEKINSTIKYLNEHKKEIGIALKNPLFNQILEYNRRIYESNN